MAGGMGSAAGSAIGVYGPSSETDGEFDDQTDYDDLDEWDYQEILSNVSKGFKTYVLQPVVIGAAAAFGMSLGYAIFDATTSLFSGRRTAQPKGDAR